MVELLIVATSFLDPALIGREKNSARPRAISTDWPWHDVVGVVDSSDARPRFSPTVQRWRYHFTKRIAVALRTPWCCEMSFFFSSFDFEPDSGPHAAKTQAGGLAAGRMGRYLPPNI